MSSPSITLPAPRPGLEEARDVLARWWGFSDFRPPQRRVIAGVLRGRDVLALLPTGGGKSLCFQVPAIALPGMTLVVSPLVSLMQDQVGSLERRGIPAACLSGAQPEPTQREVWRRVAAGEVKLLYVAPERLEQIVARLPPLMVSLLAVDESHCISEWGHDFRPHYRLLGKHRGALGMPQVVAVTATATPLTRRDIAAVLGLRNPVVVLSSFDRPNLTFTARRMATDRDRLRAAARIIRRSRGATIVYVPTRNRTDGVCAVFRRWGIPAMPYHAGLPMPERSVLVDGFSSGRLSVMVATNAFGMGIDRPDVGNVIHLGIPSRPEAYYQEAGRAGRDGRPARCDLLWTKQDLVLSRVLTERESSTTGSDRQSTVRKAALRAMHRYAMARRCRRAMLLEYFGERVGGCGGCDRCGEPQRP